MLSNPPKPPRQLHNFDALVPKIWILAAIFAVAGCGYRVGPVLKADYKTVAVPVFENRTFEPLIEGQFTNATIKRLQTDGSVKIAPVEDADAVLEVKILAWERTPLRYERRATLEVREYRLIVPCEVTLRDRRSGKILVNGVRVSGEAEFFVGDDLQSAELQVLPLVADDFAKRVTKLVTERW
jgi:hypothetical protein